MKCDFADLAPQMTRTPVEVLARLCPANGPTVQSGAQVRHQPPEKDYYYQPENKNSFYLFLLYALNFISVSLKSCLSIFLPFLSGWCSCLSVLNTDLSLRLMLTHVICVRVCVFRRPVLTF